MTEHDPPVEEPVFSPDYERAQATLAHEAKSHEQDLAAKTVEEHEHDRREPEVDEDGNPVDGTEELQDAEDPVDEDEGLWDAIEGQEEGDDDGDQ